MDSLVKIGCTLGFSGCIFLLLVIVMNVNSGQEFNEILFVEPGMLARYKGDYFDYRSVNVKRADRSLSSIPNELELMTRRLLEYERMSKEFPGYYSDEWRQLEIDIYEFYHSQDIKVMRELLEMERSREWRGSSTSRLH